MIFFVLLMIVCFWVAVNFIASSDTCSSGEIRRYGNEIDIGYPTSRRTTSSRIQICSEDIELIDICSDIDLDEKTIINIACYSDGKWRLLK